MSRARRELKEPHTANGVRLEDLTSAPLNRLNEPAPHSRSMSSDNVSSAVPIRRQADPIVDMSRLLPRPPGLPANFPWPPPPPPPGWAPYASIHQDSSYAAPSSFPPPPFWGSRPPPPPPPAPYWVQPAVASSRDDYAEEQRTTNRPTHHQTTKSDATPRATNRSTTSYRQGMPQRPVHTTARTSSATARSSSGIVSRARDVAEANRGATQMILSANPTPSQLEVQRIRSLRAGAADHFIRRSTSPEQPPHHDQRRAMQERAEMVARREALLDAHRNNAERDRPKRSTTPSATARPRIRSPSAGARGEARIPTLRELKGDIPDVQRSLREGVPPRRVPARDGTGIPDDVQREATEYLNGIRNLYLRMRESYAEFKRHPESFISHSLPSGSPPRSRGATKNASYEPVSLPQTISVKPSAEAQRLRDELEKLERQWERLDSQRNLEDIPRTREAVLEHVSDVLRSSRSSAVTAS